MCREEKESERDGERIATKTEKYKYTDSLTDRLFFKPTAATGGTEKSLLYNRTEQRAGGGGGGGG